MASKFKKTKETFTRIIPSLPGKCSPLTASVLRLEIHGVRETSNRNEEPAVFGNGGFLHVI